MKRKFGVFILLLMCLLITLTGPVSYAATSPSLNNQIEMEDELFNKKNNEMKGDIINEKQ